jgi:hypothetical protein
MAHVYIDSPVANSKMGTAFLVWGRWDLVAKVPGGVGDGYSITCTFTVNGNAFTQTAVLYTVSGTSYWRAAFPASLNLKNQAANSATISADLYDNGTFIIRSLARNVFFDKSVSVALNTPSIVNGHVSPSGTGTDGTGICWLEDNNNPGVPYQTDTEDITVSNGVWSVSASFTVPSSYTIFVEERKNASGADCSAYDQYPAA